MNKFMKIMTVAFAAVILASCGKESPVDIEPPHVKPGEVTQKPSEMPHCGFLPSLRGSYVCQKLYRRCNHTRGRFNSH